MIKYTLLIFILLFTKISFVYAIDMNDCEKGIRVGMTGIDEEPDGTIIRCSYYDSKIKVKWDNGFSDYYTPISLCLTDFTCNAKKVATEIAIECVFGLFGIGDTCNSEKKSAK